MRARHGSARFSDIFRRHRGGVSWCHWQGDKPRTDHSEEQFVLVELFPLGRVARKTTIPTTMTTKKTISMTLSFICCPLRNLEAAWFVPVDNRTITKRATISNIFTRHQAVFSDILDATPDHGHLASSGHVRRTSRSPDSWTPCIFGRAVGPRLSRLRSSGLQRAFEIPLKAHSHWQQLN